jgi:hypothetical protein
VNARKRKNVVKNATKKKVIGAIAINLLDTTKTIFLEKLDLLLHLLIPRAINLVT